MSQLTATQINAGTVYAGGGSEIQFYLTEAQDTALRAYNGRSGTAAAGWYEFFPDLAGGQFGYDRDVTTIRNEANEDLGDAVSRNEAVWTNTAMGTTAVAVKTLEWLESNFVPVRCVLPVTNDGSFASGTTPGQIIAAKRARMRKTNRSLPTGSGAVRQMEFELVASPPLTGGRVFEIEDVADLHTESGWPASVAFAKNTPA